MKMNQFAIIGAGQLGIRHLQAFALLKEKMVLWINDVSSAALELSIKRWQEAGDPEHASVKLSDSIGKLPTNLLVAVVATNAGVRKKVIAELLSHSQVSFLVLEKFLFNCLADFEEVQNLLDKKQVSAWVNCPRRMFPGYQYLKSYLSPPFEIYVKGTNWGLACNAIHWLDLMHYLNPAEKYSIEGKLGPIFNSKRAGYIEFNGTLLIRDEYQDSLHLSCEEGDAVSVAVEIREKNGRITRINETEQLISFENGLTEIFPVWRQSQMTNKVVEQLLAGASCELNTFAISSMLHQVLFNFFLKHYNQLNNTPYNTLCPVT